MTDGHTDEWGDEWAGGRWDALRRLTAARIGLRRSGPGIATTDHLAFRLAHALARDAVGSTLDVPALAAEVGRLGLVTLEVASACPDQASFLTRPDLGRRLREGEGARLAAVAGGADVVMLLAGGLSAQAVQRHAVPLLAATLPALRTWGWRVAPVCIVRFGRVALGDEVGAALGGRLVVVLIGERPGLSAPDSLGAYLTFEPRPGRTDADRNCLSNIRPDGMPVAEAAGRLLWHLQEARRRGLTGVLLKDESAGSLASPAALSLARGSAGIDRVGRGAPWWGARAHPTLRIRFIRGGGEAVVRLD